MSTHACADCGHKPLTGGPYCPACAGFQGASDDVGNLVTLAVTTFAVVCLALTVYVLGPNISAGRAISRVRESDPQGVSDIEAALAAHKISADQTGLGWDVLRFGPVFLVEFSYLDSKDKEPRRYAVWWAYRGDTDKVFSVQKADEFIDGQLLRFGLTRIFPAGIDKVTDPADLALK